VTIFMILIPLCYAPGRADRVTPLFRCVRARRPLLPSPAQSAGWNGSRLFVASAMDWFKCDWEDWEVRGLTKWLPASMVGSDGEVPVHCHHSFTVGSSLRLSNYRQRAESAPRLLVSFAEADHHCRAATVNLLEDKMQEGRVYVSTYPTMMGLIDEADAGERRFGVGHLRRGAGNGIHYNNSVDGVRRGAESLMLLSNT
jgi:hypothetical protein